MTAVDVVALVWAPHEARTASFAEWLEAPLYNIHYLRYRQRIYAPFKYPLQWIKTWYEMARIQPRYIYFNDSPPIAGLCVYTYCLFTRTQYIMDTHTPNLFGKKWGWTTPLQRFLARHARMNIVDQEAVKKTFDSWGAPVMVLENPPKKIQQEWLVPTAPKEDFKITYIGTFGGDEPIEIVIEAARHLSHIQFYILGDKSRADPKLLQDVPENVIFPGYLLKEDYWGLLAGSRCIIALTKMSFSLSGAAQDGISIQKPVIISDQPPLRLYFSKGALFVQHNTESMVNAIQTLLQNEETLNQEIAELYLETNERWQQNFQRLLDIINF